eukprot:s3431_g3.t1
MAVVDELSHGASLTGDVDKTDFKFTPALLSEASLRSQSAMRKLFVERDYKGSGGSEVDQVVWQQTVDEYELGWLEGPLSSADVAADAPIYRRFGLRQRHEIRLIDDFSESAISQSVAVYITPTLHTVDIASAALSCWFADCSSLQRDSSLLIRTFDLSSAYRQVALSEHGRAFSFIRVFNPETQCWSYFRAKVLPSGAVKSVHSFLRLARAIWWIGTVACLLFWTSFFDDYIVFSTPLLFPLLGWDYAKDGRKCMPFRETCEALGVLFDLTKSSQGLGV